MISWPARAGRALLRWLSRSPAPVEREPMAAECEAFLSGRYLSWLSVRGRPIPAWAWVNGLAHGSADDVAACAAGGDEPGGPRQLVAELARLVQATTRETGCSLHDLQRDSLVPWESRLHSLFGSAPARDRLELAQWLVLALNDLSGPGDPRRRSSPDGPGIPDRFRRQG